jgi:RNA polymerase sigma-70 factor (ECF subfamily)
MPDANAIPVTPTTATAAPQPAAGARPASFAEAPIQTTSETFQESTDEEAMLALGQGSEAAFNTLFRRYRQPVFGFFHRRLADSARAEELAQETFVALFRSARRYQPLAPFRSYLYAIAFRILRSDRRKSQFRAMFFGSPTAADAASVPSNPENFLWVRRALAKLGPIDREIVMLREYQQLSYSEIAALLKIPLNTVRSRLFRARLALRDLLEPPTGQASSAGRSPENSATGNIAQHAEQIISAKKGERR